MPAGEVGHYGPDDVGPEGTVKAAVVRLVGTEFGCADSPIDHAWGFTPAISTWIDSQIARVLATERAR